VPIKNRTAFEKLIATVDETAPFLCIYFILLQQLRKLQLFKNSLVYIGTLFRLVAFIA